MLILIPSWLFNWFCALCRCVKQTEALKTSCKLPSGDLPSLREKSSGKLSVFSPCAFCWYFSDIKWYFSALTNGVHVKVLIFRHVLWNQCLFSSGICWFAHFFMDQAPLSSPEAEYTSFKSYIECCICIGVLHRIAILTQLQFYVLEIRLRNKEHLKMGIICFPCLLSAAWMRADGWG